MSLLDKARELDRGRNAVAAAQAYEEGLRHGEGDRMTYGDLVWCPTNNWTVVAQLAYDAGHASEAARADLETLSTRRD